MVPSNQANPLWGINVIGSCQFWSSFITVSHIWLHTGIIWDNVKTCTGAWTPRDFTLIGMQCSLGTGCFKIIPADSSKQESLRSIVMGLPFPNLQNTRYSLGSQEVKEGDETRKHLNYSQYLKECDFLPLSHLLQPQPHTGRGGNQWLSTVSLLSHQGHRRCQVYQ